MATLSTKLGLKPGQRVCILSPPAESEPAAQAIREACPPSVEIFEETAAGGFDQVFFWPAEVGDLPGQFARLQRAIHPNGVVWAVIPKQRYAQARGLSLTWAAVQEAGLTTDLVDNKTASITGEEYGTRFVIRKDRR